MYINRLTITSFYEKNKILMKTKINPDQELAVQYMKDRLNARDGFLVGLDRIPERLKKKLQVPKIFRDETQNSQKSTKTFIG